MFRVHFIFVVSPPLPSPLISYSLPFSFRFLRRLLTAEENNEPCIFLQVEKEYNIFCVHMVIISMCFLFKVFWSSAVLIVFIIIELGKWKKFIHVDIH